MYENCDHVSIPENARNFPLFQSFQTGREAQSVLYSAGDREDFPLSKPSGQ